MLQTRNTTQTILGCRIKPFSFFSLFFVQLKLSAANLNQFIVQSVIVKINWLSRALSECFLEDLITDH